MYLIHDDEELAMQAFSRGQAADPENAVAWVGQAIVAIRDQDIREARDLYQHAFEIGERSFVILSLLRCLFRRLQISDSQKQYLTGFHPRKSLLSCYHPPQYSR